nr:muniscin C-terminal mu homology domain-containing protein [Tanacetum cinerariifolium]
MQEQQNSAQSSPQVEDEHVLVMELSEKDILFAKKKKLLEVKGFDPTGKVKIQGNSSIESVKSVLEEMLQRARILNSDEVDLYFGGIDASHPVGFCSPRNELDSLHLILSFVDKSKDQEMHPKVLQDLRNATLDMIYEFGNNIKEDVKIVPSWNLEKEKCLLQWGENNGVKARLDVAYVEGAGRGAIAKQDLEVGDVALEIPVSVIISDDLVRETSMFPVLENVEGMSSETMLLLWSMKEKHDTSSKFKIYFDALPEAFNTGLSFGMEAVMALDGTLLLEEIVQAKEHLRFQYDGLVPSLCKEYPDIFPPELYTWDEFLWACELWYSNSMKIMFNDGKLRTCLIPIAGFLNHSKSPHIMHYGRVDSITNSLKFPLSRPCAAGEQCYLSYGNLSSSHLITFYGFLPKGDNPYDVIPLALDFKDLQRRIISSIVNSCNAGKSLVEHELQNYSNSGKNTNAEDGDTSLGDDPLAASSGQVIVGVESRYRVVYRLVNSIYVLGITSVDDDCVNNVFECISIVNQAVSVVVTACRGVDVTPEKLGRKYAEIYMALDIVLRGVSNISIAKMVHSAYSTETFSNASFELPVETLEAGDEVAATLARSEQGPVVEQEEVKQEDEQVEKDPFAASDNLDKPVDLVGGFKKDKEQVSDMAIVLSGLEVTSLPPAAATESTHIGVEGFEGDYGGIEFSKDGSTLREDFEGINQAWGGGLDASEFVDSKKVVKPGLGGLELLETSDVPVAKIVSGAELNNLEDLVVKKPEMRGPEMHIYEVIHAEFRESELARAGLMGIVYLKTIPPKSSGETEAETEFSFKVEGTNGVKRFVMHSSSVSSLGNQMFHVRTAPSDQPIPILKYSLLPRATPLPLRVRLVKRHSGTLLSVMIQYVSNPDLPAPLTDVTFILKLPVDPRLLKVSPKAVLNRTERELQWHVQEIPLKGNPVRLRARMPVDTNEEDGGDELEVVGYVKFSYQGIKSLSGISLQPASEGKTDFFEVPNRENCAWDIKLALDFKDLQRRIISSIVNSCNAGKNLVEHELQNYSNSDSDILSLNDNACPTARDIQQELKL